MLHFSHQLRALAIVAVVSAAPLAAWAQDSEAGVQAPASPSSEAAAVPPEVEGPDAATGGLEAAASTALHTGAAQPEASVEKEAPYIMSHKKKAVWSLVGVSGAALITGGIFGLTALDEKQRYDDNPADDFKDRKDARALASYISFGVAGAAAVAALVVWLVVDDKCDPHDHEASVTTNGTSLIVKF